MIDRLKSLVAGVFLTVAVSAAASAECVRSDINEERVITSDFRASAHNSVSSQYQLRPTFVTLCISDGSVSDGDFLLIETDSFQRRYRRIGISVDEAARMVEDLRTFTRWHGIATERGDVFDRDISVDTDMKCQMVEYYERQASPNRDFLERARLDCAEAEANSYGAVNAYRQGMFVSFLRHNATRSSVSLEVTPRQVPALIELLESFTSGEIYAATPSEAELDEIYQ